MIQPLIDGRKAGESSPRQPVIAPDSARSVTLLKQVVGLSEGEIEGFGKNDIKLDGTPLSELSSEIVCDYRFGTNSQEYINGVDEVANEIGVGVELRGDLDWVKLITNTEIDAAFYGLVPFEFGASMLYFTKKGISQNLIHNLKYRNQKTRI